MQTMLMETLWKDWVILTYSFQFNISIIIFMLDFQSTYKYVGIEYQLLLNKNYDLIACFTWFSYLSF